MRDALGLVKREFGTDAVILGTRTIEPGGLGGLAGRGRVEITAAPGKPRPAPLPSTSPAAPAAAATVREPRPDIPAALYPHYVRLVQNQVAADLAADLIRRAAAQSGVGRDAGAALRAVVQEFIAQHAPRVGSNVDGEAQPRRIALVGPPGSGKTTTLAKLAAHYKARARRQVALLSLDMHRAGTLDQLRRYADLLDVPLHGVQTIDQVKAALRTPSDTLLIDTPGIGFRDQGLFARTAALLRAAHPTEIHLVLPASLTPEIQERTARAFAPLGVTRIILTRLDEVIGCGVVLNVMQRLNIALSHVTTGQNVPDDLEIACKSRLAELICPADG
jgi:flagellar biosynthesis protein FlhF